MAIAPPTADPWDDVLAVGRGPGEQEARLVVHHAVQAVAAVGHSLAPRAGDDSPQSLVAGGPTRWLGAPVGEGALRAGLEAVQLELQLCDGAGAVLATLPLGGRRLADALDFLRAELGRRGLPATGLALPTHPDDFPRHPLAEGAPFPSAGASARAELARLFAGSAQVLAGLGAGGPVLLWPHHFDLACTVKVGRTSAGLGFSPGDGALGDPYWYATFSPPPARLPPLAGGGRWRTEGWAGAELPVGRLSAPGERRAQVEAFYRSALDAARAG